MKTLAVIVSLIFFRTAMAAPFAVESGEIEFHATGQPAFLSIVGVSKSLSGSLEVNEKSISGSLSAKMDDFQTGIELRDSHMKENYIEVSRYPESSIVLSEVARIGSDFTGTLDFHGVKREVKGTFTSGKGDNNVNFTAEFKIKLKQFKIKAPNYQGVKISDDILVRVRFEAKAI